MPTPHFHSVNSLSPALPTDAPWRLQPSRLPSSPTQLPRVFLTGRGLSQAWFQRFPLLTFQFALNPPPRQIKTPVAEPKQINWTLGPGVKDHGCMRERQSPAERTLGFYSLEKMGKARCENKSNASIGVLTDALRKVNRIYQR